MINAIKAISFKEYVIVFAIWFAACARLTFPNLNGIALYAVIPALFLLSFMSDTQILRNRYIRSYSFLIVWTLVSCLVATDFQLAITMWVTMLGGWMCGIVMYSIPIQHPRANNLILLTYSILLGTTILYLFTSGDIVAINIKSSRLNESHVNANDISYLLFFAVSCFGLVLIDTGLKKSLQIILYVAFFALVIWCSLITASRQILVVILPLTFVCMLLTVSNRPFSMKTIVWCVVFAIGAYWAYKYIVSDIIDNSYLAMRMEEDAKEDVRVTLIKEALAVGFSNPILGVGNANFVHYSSSGCFSHNSYLEFFANSGLPAFFVYTLMVVGFIKEQYRKYKRTNSVVFMYLLMVSLFWFVFNFFYAFQTGPWLIAYFFLLIGYSESKYQRYTKYQVYE